MAGKVSASPQDSEHAFSYDYGNPHAGLSISGDKSIAGRANANQSSPDLKIGGALGFLAGGKFSLTEVRSELGTYYDVEVSVAFAAKGTISVRIDEDGSIVSADGSLGVGTISGVKVDTPVGSLGGTLTTELSASLNSNGETFLGGKAKLDVGTGTSGGKVEAHLGLAGFSEPIEVKTIEQMRAEQKTKQLGESLRHACDNC